MSRAIWINEKGAHTRVSNKACAFMFIMMLYIDEDNAVHKKEIFDRIAWVKDPRTANKYWKELVDNGVLAKIEGKRWMLSPHECYSVGSSYQVLLNKWNNLHAAS